MNLRSSLPLAIVLTGSIAFAADAPKAPLPPVPSQSIAKKKELLFSDDFSKGTLEKPWHQVVPTFTVADGALKGTQTRDKTVLPGPDGKGGVTAHAAVHGLEIPTKDSVVEARVKLDGTATMVDIEFDDRAYKGSHYGHICRAQLKPTGVTIIDERDGTMRNEVYENRSKPEKKAEVAEMMKGRVVTYPGKYELGKWYTMTVETVGDEMRVLIDGQPAAYLKSSGIGHATKSKLEFGVAGKDGYFDDVKVWNAEPAK